jgi:hypothetical protein
MKKPSSISANIWARRRAQTMALAAAIHKRELPAIELTDSEWELLRQADALHRQMRPKDGKK